MENERLEEEELPEVNDDDEMLESGDPQLRCDRSCSFSICVCRS